LYCDLFISVSLDNKYLSIIEKLSAYKYRFVGFYIQNLNKSNRNLVDNLLNTASQKGLHAIIRIPYQNKAFVKHRKQYKYLIYFSNKLFNQISIDDKNHFNKTINLITIDDFNELGNTYHQILKLITRRRVYIEILMVNLIRYLCSFISENRSFSEELTRLLNILKRAYENRLLLISSGATRESEILNPKLKCLFITGLLNLKNIDFSPISTWCYNLVGSLP